MFRVSASSSTKEILGLSFPLYLFKKNRLNVTGNGHLQIILLSMDLQNAASITIDMERTNK